jgi:hypothetical protein
MAKHRNFFDDMLKRTNPKRISSIEEMFDPTRPVVEPTTFIGGQPLDPTRYQFAKVCGEYLFIIAKVQAGLPLSIFERDFVADVLRQKFLKPKEYAAYRRAMKLKHIETAEELAKRTENLTNVQLRARWVRKVHGFSTKGAIKEFKRRERKTPR